MVGGQHNLRTSTTGSEVRCDSSCVCCREVPWREVDLRLPGPGRRREGSQSTVHTRHRLETGSHVPASVERVRSEPLTVLSKAVRLMHPAHRQSGSLLLDVCIELRRKERQAVTALKARMLVTLRARTEGAAGKNIQGPFCTMGSFCFLA